jgi:hypothetical protein
MPRKQTSKRRDNAWTNWVNQGLKPSNWSAQRVARIGLLIGLALAVAALYLLQSSEIVTASRRVQTLREEVWQLQQDNAELANKIARRFDRAVEKRADAGLCGGVNGVLPVRICQRQRRRFGTCIDAGRGGPGGKHQPWLLHADAYLLIRLLVILTGLVVRRSGIKCCKYQPMPGRRSLRNRHAAAGSTIATALCWPPTNAFL